MPWYWKTLTLFDIIESYICNNIDTVLRIGLLCLYRNMNRKISIEEKTVYKWDIT